MDKKRGRPPIENPRNQGYRLRVTGEELERMQYITEKTGRDIAGILRDHINKLYEELKSKE